LYQVSFIYLYFPGEGKSMMNEQQGRELPFSSRQIVPGQLGYRQLSYRQRAPVADSDALAPGQLSYRQPRRGGRRLVVGSRLLVPASLLLVLALLFAAGHTVSQLVYHPPQQLSLTPQATLSPQSALIASRVDHLLTSRVAQQQFSGSVLIARDGQVLLSKGYGMADWEKQVHDTPHTQFYLGSITKQFTAMAILILQERGKLHVRDQLCAYLAHCPPAWQPVTVHELLTHTSGIPQLPDSPVSYASPQAWIASYNDVPLAFTPGREFSYCNVCYQILGYVVEQASGEPYSVFLRQAIFDPLQMRDTGFDQNYYSLVNHAEGYASWGVKAESLGWSVAPQWSFLSGSGLLYSTVEDLYCWDQALSRHSLISQQLLNEAFTPYIAAQYGGSSYGYGWFIAKAPTPGHRLIWHDGRVDGFRTYIGRYPDDRVTIIFLSNLATVDELALASVLGQIVFAHT
jgi:CubicO group peptidase (beta-lactamase class C family)